MQEAFEKMIKELRELKVKITAESRKVSEVGADCIFDKSDILDERAAGVADALKVVRRVLREYNNGWIPCSSRLPRKEEMLTDDGNFLVQSYDGEIFTCEFDSLADGYDNPLWCCNIQIIAWQPLPQPYKPKED